MRNSEKLKLRIVHLHMNVSAFILDWTLRSANNETDKPYSQKYLSEQTQQTDPD